MPFHSILHLPIFYLSVIPLLTVFLLTEQYVCDYAYFSCGDNRTCIPMYQTCDGTKQCRDGKDEENCEYTNYYESWDLKNK